MRAKAEELRTVRRFEEIEWRTMEEHRGLHYRELLSSEDASGLGLLVANIWRESIEPGGAVLPHTHDVAEIIHFTEGKVRALLGEEWTDCSPGDTLIVPKGVLHSVENHGESPSHQVSIFVPVLPDNDGFRTFLADGTGGQMASKDG